MKTRLLVSFAIGIVIVAWFETMPSMQNGTNPWFGLQFPGHAAAFVFWGMIGGSTSAGIFVAGTVNAIFYGTAIFIVLSLLRSLLGLVRPRN